MYYSAQRLTIVDALDFSSCCHYRCLTTQRNSLLEKYDAMTLKKNRILSLILMTLKKSRILSLILITLKKSLSLSLILILMSLETRR
jgi:hypothetical protein